jgi:hypothetical protein
MWNIAPNSLDNPAKVTITYPICFQPDSDIHTRLDDINYDSKLKSLDDKYNSYLSEFMNIVNGYYHRIFNLPDDVQKLIPEKGFLDALSDSADELPELESTLISFFRNWRHLMEMERFINNIHISKAAIKNSISINQTVSIPEKMQQILDELSILSKHVYLATNSTCLDCYFVYNDYPPFVSTTSSVKNMNLANECPRCGKKGLIHTISWDYPESISKLIIPDSSWFYEIVIGYAIANLDKVRDVYIHKKINSVINGNKIAPYEGGRNENPWFTDV